MRYVAAFLAFAILLTGCETIGNMDQKTKTGAGIGAVVGGIAGYIIDDNHPWRGAAIGAVLGAVAGGAVGNVVDRAAKESAEKNKTVQYTRTTDAGVTEQLVATPTGTEGNYNLVTVKYYRDGKLVQEEVKKVPVQ